MKIGLLIPRNGIKQYGSVYLSIVSFLNDKGHEVVHPLSNQPSDDYYARIATCDIVIAECSYPSISIGYEIANLAHQEKEIIILKTKDTDPSINDFAHFTSRKNIHIFEYQSHNLKDIITEALSYNPNQRYKKYNILFTPEMVAKLNAIARKKSLPKSVYIRQLLEKGLNSDE